MFRWANLDLPHHFQLIRSINKSVTYRASHTWKLRYAVATLGRGSQAKRRQYQYQTEGGNPGAEAPQSHQLLVVTGQFHKKLQRKWETQQTERDLD